MAFNKLLLASTHKKQLAQVAKPKEESKDASIQDQTSDVSQSELVGADETNSTQRQTTALTRIHEQGQESAKQSRENDSLTAEAQEAAAVAQTIGDGETGDDSSNLSLRERLDKLDAIIGGPGLTPLTVDGIRAHVKQIMIDLKENPEYDAILIDKDVHNILRFIRHVKDTAMETRQVKVAKKAAKAAKGAPKFGIKAEAFLNSLDLDALSRMKT